MESEFYIQARREWDERYGDLVLGKRNWQITSAGLMLLSLILALGIVWMSARTRVIPFVVEVDKLGYAITIPTALTASTTPATVERMKRSEIAANFAPRRQLLGFTRERMERATGVEPATSSLGSWHSTTELHPPCRESRYCPADCQLNPCRS